jgi:hypothetical protein
MAPKVQPVFRFEPRWKEELIVTGPGGVFILELPMGQLAAYLPTEDAWGSKAPGWAVDLWPILKAELEIWCAANRAGLEIDPTASVAPYYEAPLGGDGERARMWLWLPLVALLLAGVAWLLMR